MSKPITRAFGTRGDKERAAAAIPVSTSAPFWMHKRTIILPATKPGLFWLTAKIVMALWVAAIAIALFWPKGGPL